MADTGGQARPGQYPYMHRFKRVPLGTSKWVLSECWVSVFWMSMYWVRVLNDNVNDTNRLDWTRLAVAIIDMNIAVSYRLPYSKAQLIWAWINGWYSMVWLARSRRDDHFGSTIVIWGFWYIIVFVFQWFRMPCRKAVWLALGPGRGLLTRSMLVRE